MALSKYPRLTCVNCGETKTALHFPKRGGLSYEKLKAHDPRRYDTQCKRCKKPAKPGQDRSKVKEPRVLSRKRPNIGKKRKKKSEKLSQNDYKQKIRRETRIRSMQYLAEKGCEECGERDPRVLEYDHRHPVKKKRTISRLIIDGFSWSSRTLRSEIRKCRVLCSNCHRRHTIEQQGYYSHEEIQRELGDLSARYEFDL